MSEIKTLDDLLRSTDPAPPKRKLLVIDDKVEVVEGIRHSRLARAYEILSAGNGKDGLARLGEDCEIGVVLLDMLMPVMSGEEFLKALRGAPGGFNKCTRVIVYTAFAGRGVNEADILRQYGPIRFLTKATDPAVIEAEIRNAYTEHDTELAVRLDLQKTHGELLEAERALAEEKRRAMVRGLTAQFAHDINNAGQAAESQLRHARRALEDHGVVEVARDEPSLRRALHTVYDSVARTETALRSIADTVRRSREAVAADDFEPRKGSINAELAGWALPGEAPVRLQLDPSLGESLFDPGLLYRAVVNAVVNAQAAVSRRQAAEPGFQPEIVVATSLGDGHVTVAVRDNGVGMTSDDLRKIAEGVHWTTKQGGRGVVGLGTAIIRTVAEAHGGAVEFDSQPSSYTECRIRFPNRPA